MSNYIVNRVPNMYGGHQQNYVEQTNTIIKETVLTFRKAVATNQDLIDVFFQTLSSFGKARNRIAIEHGTQKAEYFGKRRDQDPFLGPTHATPLIRPYDEYGNRLLPIFQKHLHTIKHTPRAFEQTELKIQREKYLGRASSIEFTILTYENQEKWGFFYTEKEYQRLCSLCSVPPLETPFEPTHFNDLIGNKIAMQKLKQVDPDAYKRLKLRLEIDPMRNCFEGKKSDWVIATERFEIDGKMVATSQYLTWLYRDFKEDPIDHMTGRSVIAIMHQDPFLIDMTLRDIAKIFKEAIEWDGKNLETLKNHVKLMEYEFAHCDLYRRGSAGISEWLEMSIYLYHGYTLTYNPIKMVNLEALTLTFKEFAENYDSMIQLEKN